MINVWQIYYYNVENVQNPVLEVQYQRYASQDPTLKLKSKIEFYSFAARQNFLGWGKKYDIQPKCGRHSWLMMHQQGAVRALYAQTEVMRSCDCSPYLELIGRWLSKKETRNGQVKPGKIQCTPFTSWGTSWHFTCMQIFCMHGPGFMFPDTSLRLRFFNEVTHYSEQWGWLMCIQFSWQLPYITFNQE